MLRKFGLPLLAVGMLVFAVFHVVRRSSAAEGGAAGRRRRAARSASTVAGAGIVEAQTENIAIGSPLPGVVDGGAGQGRPEGRSRAIRCSGSTTAQCGRS